jgi:hypothetical protein
MRKRAENRRAAMLDRRARDLAARAERDDAPGAKAPPNPRRFRHESRVVLRKATGLLANRRDLNRALRELDGLLDHLTDR